MAYLTLTIGGVNVTSLYLMRQAPLEWQNGLTGPDRLTFELEDTAGAYRPAYGAPVVLTRGAETLFSGYIHEVAEDRIGRVGALHHRVVALDKSELLRRHLVARVYEARIHTGPPVGDATHGTVWDPSAGTGTAHVGDAVGCLTVSQAAGAVARDLLGKDLAGEPLTYSSATVLDGIQIGKVVFNYRTAAQALDELADLIGYYWWVDAAGIVYFQPRSGVAAPFAITTALNNFRTMSVRTVGEQYRNRQYVRASQGVTNLRTEAVKGNGSARTFLLRFPVAYTPGPDATTPQVKVNGLPYAIGADGQTGYPFYWQKGSNTIRQDDAQPILGSADTLEIQYQGFYPTVVVSQVDSEITARAAVEGTTGAYESLLEDATIETTATAIAKAAALLRRYGVAPGSDREVTFTTDSHGLRAGQLLTITVPTHSLSGSFLIESVTGRDEAGKALVYTVKAQEGEIKAGFEGFFKSLLDRFKRPGIAENETLVRLQAMPAARAAETVTLTDSLAVVHVP